MKRSDVVAGLILVVLPAVVLGAVFIDRNDERGDPGPARLGDLAADCRRDEPFDRCDQRVADVQSALKNAATAEESYATVNKGRYTRRLLDLEKEGLQLPPHVELSVKGPVRDGYCIEATARGVAGVMHYSSEVGSPEDGRCP